MHTRHFTKGRAFFRSERERWQSEYVRRLRVSDAAVIGATVALAQLAQFSVIAQQTTQLASTVLAGTIAVVWIGFLALLGTRSPEVIGSGAEEYRRVCSATFRLFGVIAVLSLLLRTDVARGYLAIAFPLGMIGLLLGRRAWRRVAVRKRAHGEYQTSVLVVGISTAVPDVADAFLRNAQAGYHVVGVCTPEGPTPDASTMDVRGQEIPIVGDDCNIIDAVKLTAADTVAITTTDRLGPARIKRLVWDLGEIGVDVVVTPGQLDIPDSRLRTRPVASMPLLHIEKPQYDRAKSLYKRTFDVAFASLALLALLPVMVGSAIAIKVTSRGPVFYKSERMGLDGEPFRMIKFRSMYQDTDSHLSALLSQNENAGLLFKMKKDPRVTRVGRFLRRHSLDELPQFVNVLSGEMSVVGPRPPLRSEMEHYDPHVRRRMLVKPGITGLWQVSGRSNLSWEESVRLDLTYVENWSMMEDLKILTRTPRAVARGDEAY